MSPRFHGSTFGRPDSIEVLQESSDFTPSNPYRVIFVTSLIFRHLELHHCYQRSPRKEAATIIVETTNLGLNI
jgi:hypothetical protein